VEFVLAALATVGVLFAFGIFFGIVSSILYICRPNEVLIVSGRKSVLPNGQVRGFTPRFGGRVLKWPVIEQVQRLDLTTLDVEIQISNAYSKGGIPLNVHAVANVKISDDEQVFGNASERLLGRSRDEIRNFAKQTLEGHLRGVIAQLTPEQMNSDRIQFAQTLADEAEHDLKKLGLHLDTFNIHHVTDDANYLNSVGRQRIAMIRREAEIAESNAQREAAEQESVANGQAQVAQQRAEQAIATKANEVRKAKAEFEASAASAEERAKAAAETARAVAEQELQRIRAELEGKRLAADVIVKADAENQAKAILARGSAAPIAERGKAVAQSLELMNSAWVEAGDGARQIVLIQQLEAVLKQVVEKLDQVKVGTVSLVDSGDGTSLPNYIASYPAAVTRILEELKGAIGIDVAGTLTAPGNGQDALPHSPPSRAASRKSVELPGQIDQNSEES
jgi:flotillin